MKSIPSGYMDRRNVRDHETLSIVAQGLSLSFILLYLNSQLMGNMFFIVCFVHLSKTGKQIKSIGTVNSRSVLATRFQASRLRAGEQA